jgi:hypothetical protein
MKEPPAWKEIRHCDINGPDQADAGQVSGREVSNTAGQDKRQADQQDQEDDQQSACQWKSPGSRSGGRVKPTPGRSRRWKGKAARNPGFDGQEAAANLPAGWPPHEPDRKRLGASQPINSALKLSARI